MWVLDFTPNSVTMLALVLMVGIVIDDAFVVLENIFRFVEEKGLSPIEAARQGTHEIATAVLATTLSLAVIFIPVSFMSSISGRFLFQFGITAAVAVMVSMLVSFILTPALSARLFRKEDMTSGEGPASRRGLYRLVDRSCMATLGEAETASRIDRLDRSRIANVRASLAPGFALAERTAALEAEFEAMNTPAAYTVSVRGVGRELERTRNEFILAFILSIVFMYMILASQYENLIHPVTILLALPLAVPFALLSLYLAGQQLNLYSALGILVLFGVVKKSSILQVDHMNNLRRTGMNRLDAIMQGNRDRLRPILMTTMSLVAGMLPLWVGTGPGAEERRAVAVVVIRGQTLSLLITLLVTPVAYSLLDDAIAFARRLKPAPVAPAGGVWTSASVSHDSTPD